VRGQPDHLIADEKDLFVIDAHKARTLIWKFTPEGFPDYFDQSDQETLRGGRNQYRHPPVKQRAPFVHGCVPHDTDPRHDTGRV